MHFFLFWGKFSLVFYKHFASWHKFIIIIIYNKILNCDMLKWQAYQNNNNYIFFFFSF